MSSLLLRHSVSKRGGNVNRLRFSHKLTTGTTRTSPRQWTGTTITTSNSFGSLSTVAGNPKFTFSNSTNLFTGYNNNNNHDLETMLRLLRQQQQQRSFSTVWLPLWLTDPKIPKGFENFFPKRKKTDKEASSSSSSSSSSTSTTEEAGSEKPSTSFQSSNNKDDKNKQQNSRRPPPPPQDDETNPQNIPALLAMLVLVVAARSFLLDNDDENGTGRNGKEITFVDFRNHLLSTGQVDKIVVVNQKVARVLLHPGSKGMPKTHASQPNHQWNDGSLPTSGPSNTTVLTSGDGTQKGGDITVMEFTNPTSSSESMLGMDAAGRTRSMDTSSSSSNNKIGGHNRNNAPVYHFYIGSVESFEDKLSKAQHHIHPKDWVPVQYINEVNIFLELIKATPLLATIGIIYYFTRGIMGGGIGGVGGGGGGGPGGMGSIFQIGKSNAKKINPESVKVNFSDVAGCQQAKVEIMEFVDFLQDATRFTKLGAKVPKGALLCGPPGTGKTLLAKAVAGEAGVPFYSISGSDFIEMFVGVGPSRVRDLFAEARANSPCIIFIDEIDAVGRQRGRGGFSGGNDERENTLNQLLVEMDGFSPTTGIVVLAGTNRVDILDQALTRPGRFDRQITVDKPDLQGRKEIFNVHLKGIKLQGDNPDDYAGRLAGLTPGFAGADIANLCNEAAIVAARRKAESVSIDDFEKATDRIIGGLESTKLMSDHEKSIVAHHEAGHAIAGWFLEHTDPLLKVTIIPRTSGALGFAQYLPKEVNLRTEEQIMDIICMALAGRAAEQVFFGKVTTGASDDLRRVTQLVYSMIQMYGMNSRVGQLAFPQQGQQSDRLGGDKPYSDATAEAMDDEARILVEKAYERTMELIIKHKSQVETVAKLLLDKETITHDDLIATIGERPYPGDAQYQEYVSQRHRHLQEKEKEADKESNDNDKEKEEGSLNPNNEPPLTPGLA